MENRVPLAKPKRKALISYKGWVIILLMAFLATLRRVPGENIDYLAGRFVGTVLIIAAIWTFVAFIIRWVSHKKATQY